MKRQIGVSLDEDLIEALDQWAAKAGLSRSAAVRIVLRGQTTMGYMDYAAVLERLVRHEINAEDVPHLARLANHIEQAVGQWASS